MSTTGCKSQPITNWQIQTVAIVAFCAFVPPLFFHGFSPCSGNDTKGFWAIFTFYLLKSGFFIICS